MALNKMFVRHKIIEVSKNCYQLVITYSYYWLYQFKESFCFTTLADAERRLLLERIHTDKINVVSVDGDKLEN